MIGSPRQLRASGPPVARTHNDETLVYRIEFHAVRRWTPSHDGCMRKGAAADQAAGATLSWSEVSHADNSHSDGPLAPVPA